MIRSGSISASGRDVGWRLRAACCSPCLEVLRSRRPSLVSGEITSSPLSAVGAGFGRGPAEQGIDRVVAARRGHESDRGASAARPGIGRGLTEVFLDAQQLVELRRAVDRAGAPALIWPQFVATARSAIVASSVSPDRCDITLE